MDKTGFQPRFGRLTLASKAKERSQPRFQGAAMSATIATLENCLYCKGASHRVSGTQTNNMAEEPQHGWGKPATPIKLIHWDVMGDPIRPPITPAELKVPRVPRSLQLPRTESNASLTLQVGLEPPPDSDPVPPTPAPEDRDKRPNFVFPSLPEARGNQAASSPLPTLRRCRRISEEEMRRYCPSAGKVQSPNQQYCAPEVLGAT